MNKEEYVQLHTLLAKLKFELQMDLVQMSEINYLQILRTQIDAIDEVMKIFVMECE